MASPNLCSDCWLRDSYMSEGAKAAAWGCFAQKPGEPFRLLGYIARRAQPPITSSPNDFDRDYLSTVVNRAPEHLRPLAALVACYISRNPKIDECVVAEDYIYSRTDIPLQPEAQNEQPLNNVSRIEM